MPNSNVIFHLLDGQIVKTIVNTCEQSGTHENLFVVLSGTTHTFCQKAKMCTFELRSLT